MEDAILNGNFQSVKCIITSDPESVHIKYYKKWTPLDEAIAHRELEIAKFLYEKGGRPNLEVYRDRIWTPIHVAAEYGCTEILKWVFTENILPLYVINIKDHCGMTPLDAAIEKGNLASAKLLWGMGGQPNLEIYCDGQWTPIYTRSRIVRDDDIAATWKWAFAENILPLHVVNIKRDHYDLDQTPLDCAITEGKLEIAKLLWEKGGKPNLENYCNEERRTPIHYAAQGGFADTLKWVFEKGVLPQSKLNIKDTDNKTPLDVAITYGRLKTTKLLWDMGGRPNLEIYHEEWSPMHKAVRYTKTLKWVFKNNVLSLEVLQVKDLWGATLLDNAIQFGNLKMVQFLQMNGVRSNKLDIFKIAQYGSDNHIETLEWVLENNILSFDDMYNVKTISEWTPLDYAILMGRPEMVQYLWEKGGRPNLEIYYNYGRKYQIYPVHNAVRDRQIKNLKWAFENKVLPLEVLTIEDCHGKIPFEVAINEKERAIFQRLLIDPVFLAMQRAKRDYQCVLRRLPDELLDLVVDEVAARFHLKVVWH